MFRLSEWATQCESILTALGVPYDFERFSGPTDQLPDTYIVYFLVDDPGASHADGVERSHEARIQVSLFYRNKSDFLTIPNQIEAAFMAAKFLRVGPGRIPYNEVTGHNGWRCDFRFYEKR